jgi:DNA-binding transcriptional ArsR family regulator
MNEPELTISSEEIKALSSETRIDVLKLLNERKYTLAELSKIKKVSAPSMKQQLKVLEENNLIHQLNEGRKWKYYELTVKGKQLLESKKKPIHVTLILSASILLLFLTGLVFYANTLIYSSVSDPGLIAMNMHETGFESDSIHTDAGLKTSSEENQIKETPPETENNLTVNLNKTPDLTYLNINFIIAVFLSFIIGYYLRQKLKEE